MIRIGLVVLLVLLVSTSYGAMLNKRLNFKLNDFVTPIGFALLMMLLQFVYYPAMLFNLSSDYEHIVSVVIFVLGIFFALKNYKEIINEYLNPKSIIIALSFAVFVLVFYQCYIDISYSDAPMYLNYMSQNIDIKQINMFNLWTGEKGAEWDTIYLFQGYYHFGSFISWLVNIDHYLLGANLAVDNIVIQTWGLGMLYSFMSSMLIYNFASYFKLNKWSKYLILVFGLFYLNFFYWRVALSFYGNTFRTIYTCALMFYLYRYFKEERIDFKWICVIIGFAGISFSSSFLFISFSVMYALMVYIFYTKRRNSIMEMADFVLPILVYALACFYKDNTMLFTIGIIAASLYFLLRDKAFMLKITDTIEGFLNKNAIQIFVYGVATTLAIGGAIYYFVINPGYEYNYAHYFQEHSNYDMIKDFFFIYSGRSEKLVNVLRWLGVFLLFTDKSDDKGIKFFKYLFLVLFIVFLSPLSVIGISKLIASNVYYRTFDVVFNPLTEMLFIVLVLKRFNKKWLYYGLSLFVIYMVTYAHIGSQINHYTGEYGFHINREVLPKYKISQYDYDVIKALQYEVEMHEDEDLRVISHADGLRTFIPDAYQIFTTYQLYYPGTRVNEEFFQQAQRRYSYMNYTYNHFANVCEHMEKYQVDYAIVSWYENVDLDIELSKCGELLYTNDVYKLYKFNW